MEEETGYWLGFSCFPGIGPLRFRLLLDALGSAKDAWYASGDTLRQVGLGVSLVERFTLFRSSFDIASFLSFLSKKEISFFILPDPEYPSLLKEISDPPYVLYVRGIMPKGPRVGVVGTRKITAYGREVTKHICSGLLNAGVTIVSGLAYGVDTVAHQMAVEKSGYTIAVLGCGVDIIYPRSNTSLYWSIINGRGCILSEFPPGTYTEKGTFPARNRIISGLSSGIVLTEGSADSGALITAKYAAQQGREVYAVPGQITSEMSAAPMLLLKQGAKMVTQAQDILDDIGIIKKQRSTKRVASLSFVSPKEKCIYDLLSLEPLSVDALAEKSGIPAGEIGSILTMMEMEGKVTSDDGGIYRL